METHRHSLNTIGTQIVASAIEVHRTLGGPGLLESLYEEALAWELAQAGYVVQRQVALPAVYKGFVLQGSLRLDLLINDSVIVECKATTEYKPVFQSQVLTYLRLSGLKLGYLINFGERFVSKGIHRIVNGSIDE